MPHFSDRLLPTALIPAIVVGVAAAAPIVVYATDYLTLAQAQKLMFPDASQFASQAPVLLTQAQATRVAGATGGSVNTSQWRVATAQASDGRVLGYVVADAVIGKFQLINYAVAFAPDGAIRDVEILSYREEHGGEVRTAAWRKQFAGKTGASPIRIDDDIRNISGATLSCTHLTDGIGRLARYVQAVLVGKS
ncbi:MAG: putative FMN-binding protein [Burkholderiaceae bacterium]|jgi:Na+-translocating ferredoxin:NAD+ oxidoreductase RnfG subunit|nr:MAG: putative FMN-binding protein [Burkholderiaceae bacterium]